MMVPCTTEPFLSSTVTVSLFSFIKNLKVVSQLANDEHTVAPMSNANESSSSSVTVAHQHRQTMKEPERTLYSPYELHLDGRRR